MPVFPGQLRYIRKNLFHAVYVLDPASICGLEVMLIIARGVVLTRLLINGSNWLMFYTCMSNG